MVFSILIPVYNVERYLEQCLKSVLSQDFRDFEVILVNDGSTDSSSEICKDFSQKDIRIKYYEKENEGLLQTRRFSIKKASGEYLLFLDSDDFWEQGLLSTLYSEISKHKIDLIYYRYRTVDDKGNPISEDKGIFPDRVLFTEENKDVFIETFVSSSKLNMMWIKCVRQAIVDRDADYSVYRDKKGEDLLQSIPLIRNAASILYMDKVFVNYRLSVSGRGRNIQLQYLDDYETVRGVLKTNLEQMNVSGMIMNRFYSRYIDGLMSFMDSIALTPGKKPAFRKTCDHIRGFKLYKEARKAIVSSSIISRNHYIDYVLLERKWDYLLYYIHRIRNILKTISPT